MKLDDYDCECCSGPMTVGEAISIGVAIVSLVVGVSVGSVVGRMLFDYWNQK